MSNNKKTLFDVKTRNNQGKTKAGKTITDADYSLRDKASPKDKRNIIYMPGTETAQEFRERIVQEKIAKLEAEKKLKELEAEAKADANKTTAKRTSTKAE